MSKYSGLQVPPNRSTRERVGLVVDGGNAAAAVKTISAAEAAEIEQIWMGQSPTWHAIRSFWHSRLCLYMILHLVDCVSESCVFINYAVWESTQHFKLAFNKPEFRAKLEDYPESTITSPHLFKKVAVPGICIDH